MLGELAGAGVRVVGLGEAAGGAGPAGVHRVRDAEGTYRAWFAELGCSAVAVRPDFYVYGSAGGPEDAVRLAGELVAALTSAGAAAPAARTA